MPKGEVKARGRQVEDSKRLLLEQLAQGQTVARALQVIGRSRPTYESWRQKATTGGLCCRSQSQKRSSLLPMSSSGPVIAVWA